ncbi:disease resistance protein At4g27190-like [Corylus avellana]|uniref:disease resistance protein At4g27190-like n=1 Tax=Corylus avellana TaxID=13451 RepID=UPI00286B44E2|nr:disease resistance protein At4g27190-like [Corylus avellana]
MEVLSAVVTKIAELLVAPIGQWLCYSFDYDNNIKTMEDKLQTLQSRRDSVQHSVDSARRNGEEIEALVTTWLTKADETIEEAREIVPVEERAQPRCSNGACLNLKLRHQLSRKAKKMVQLIDHVLENDKFEKVSYRPALEGEVSRRQMDYMDFVSRMSTDKGLMEALGDANTNVIGLWGMAGAGKTTLVREVARQAKEKMLFDEVAMAYVTQNPDTRRIQGEIADMLDLKLDAETEIGRAYRLRQRLTKHKKTLVILDDIWMKLDLEKIGISTTECKVVLTSRDKNLLSCEMGTQKDFGLEELPENEAWNLFAIKAGDCVKDPHLRCTATEVAKECAGLPIALVTVSKALKNKRISEWKNALEQLRRPAPGHLTRMQSIIYSSIELSYSHLENEEVQHLFLLCAEMSYTINYLDLLKYCYGLGSFHGITTLEEARNRLDSHVRNLKDSCLLLDCPHGSDHCHMHDVVRDVATFIASRDHNMFVVRENSGLKKWPDVDALKRCKTFSIRGGDIHELPNEMECPDLRYFYVYGRDQSLQIPETFFKGMGKVQVLDLTKMKLPSLPSSLSLLGNLQTLCLDQCVLEDIAIIGELRNLVVLSLFSSNLSQLPREIGLLTHLRLLDLSNCSKLEVVPPNVLSSLVELEELYMGNSFVQWETEGPNFERNNASLAELKDLSQLITLEIHITDVRNLPKDLSFEKLERYAISIGDYVWDSSKKREASKTLKLKLNTTFQSEVEIKMLLKRTEALYLDELKGVKSLLNELDRGGFQQLKHLHIQNNQEIKYIINLRISVVAFPALETFFLENMMSLEEICHGQLPFTSFRNLRIVKVQHCDKLKFVFSSSMAWGLKQLEELEVRECSIMGAIVMREEGSIEDTDAFLFPQLRRLALKHLPELISFLSTQKPFITDPREIISDGKFDFHMPILHEQVVFPIARSSCRLAIAQATSRFENLSYLEVQGSSNIKYILSFSTARFMVQLRHLHVLECELVEEILFTEELVVEEITPKTEVLFSRLECLFLKKLPSLERFCVGSNIEFPSLKSLKIECCPKLKTFIFKPVRSSMTVNKELKEMNAEERPHSIMQSFFNEEVMFPILDTLKLSSVNLAEIEQNQNPACSVCRLRNMQATSRFENLTYLEVEGSGNIKYILSFSAARFMVQLKHLHVLECEDLEEILVTEELGVVEEITQEAEVLFPQLECLFLKKLPILKRFCVGHNIEFPSLKKLGIEHCPKLETFISKPLSSGMMISKELKEMNAEESLHSVMHPFFNEEVAFHSLERLVISHVDCLKIIWKNQFTIDSFCKLQFIKVEFCENLLNIFHSNMLTRFQSLETLVVANCGVEEIVAREKGAEAIARFVFPQITHLRLEHLPRLKWFYPGKHASEWPLLKTLTVEGCQKVDLFTSELLSFEETLQESEVEISIKQPLFLVDEATFPNLESLTLAHYHTIWSGQFLEELFCKLKVLQLTSNHNESDVCPPNFVQRLNNLEKLVLHRSFWEEIFPYEELHGQEQHAGKEDAQPSPIVQNLEILEVSECGKLKILAPSSVSFQNLSELEILKCHGLINLVKSSTAKSLVQLKKLSVCECEMITEIVRGDGGEGNDQVITFSKLTSLKLDCLPQLSNFCSGGYSFEFPSLEEVIVSQCQEMKIFTDGVLSTPKLKRVQGTKEDERHWKDDLNTTIHWLWESKLCIPPSNGCSDKGV